MSETSPSRQSPTLATNSPDKKYSKKNIKYTKMQQPTLMQTNWQYLRKKDAKHRKIKPKPTIIYKNCFNCGTQYNTELL